MPRWARLRRRCVTGRAGRGRGGVALVRDQQPPGARRDVPTTLTRREWEVARLIARGYTNRDIAETLVVTRGTVANHVAHILDKLNASNRTQIAAYCLRLSAQGRTAPDIGDGWDDERIR